MSSPSLVGIIIISLSLTGVTFGQERLKSCHLDVPYEVRGNTTLVQVDGSQSSVQFESHVSIVMLPDGRADVRVRHLQLTDGNAMIPNPSGIYLPVIVEMLNPSPDDPNMMDHKLNLMYSDLDMPDSRAVKQAIIDLLAKQAFDDAQASQKITNLPQIQATLNILKEGDEKIVLPQENKNMVLILGNSGAGKSTLTQWIIGDGSSLEAEPVNENDDEFIISDNFDRIGTSTINSKTIFPELAVDVESNTNFYDFPGFSDTRNSSYDLAASYFIKKVINKADAVKIVIVIIYPSVRKGVDRQDFLTLLKHITELITDIAKFQNSISLIVTKVDNQYIIKRKQAILVSDEKIINRIAGFLEDTKQDLVERLNISITNKDMMFYNNAINFIDAILTKENGSYTKIGIFRRPDEAGPLNGIDIFAEGKQNIKRIIHNTLTYTVKDIHDFGRTISESSKNDVNELIQVITKNILVASCDISEQIKAHYENLITPLNRMIESFNSDDISSADRHLNEITMTFDNFSVAYMITENLTQNIRNTDDLGNVPTLMYDGIIGLHLNISNETIFTMFRQAEYLSFLHDVSKQDNSIHMSALAFASSFQDILTDFEPRINNVKNSVNDLVHQFENQIKLEIMNFEIKLRKILSSEEEKSNVLNDIQDNFKSQCSNLIEIIKIVDNLNFTNSVKELASRLNLEFSEKLQSIILKKEWHSSYLRLTISNVTEYVCDTQLWYNFLINYHDKLSSYEIQSRFKSLSDAKDLYELLSSRNVAEFPLKNILKIIYQQDYVQVYNYIKHIQLDSYKIRNFEKVTKESMQNPDHYCDSNTLLITGINLRLSDLLYINCVESVKLIKIFAFKKVFIDATLTADADVAIIAPTWDIEGEQSIILDGSPAPAHRLAKAENGTYSGSVGKDGKPGLPGSAGHNFVGVGKFFINADSLTISCNGGDGGPGQNGGDGEDGYDGDQVHPKDPKQFLEDIGWWTEKYEWNWVYTQYKTYYPKNCIDGGGSGAGGEGGYGGPPGDIKIYSQENNVTVGTLTTNYGRKGDNGRHGKPGKPGKPGNYFKVNWAPLRLFSWTQIEYFTQNACKPGYTKENFNNENIEKSFKHPLKLRGIVDDYLNYIYKQTHKIILKETNNDFLKYLDDISFYE